MSHRPSCPDEYDAKREGERAFDRGAGEWRNPYRDDCDEAASAWSRGYREREREDEREHAEAAAAQRRREAREMEESRLSYEYEQQCYEAMQDEESMDERELCGTNQHMAHPDYSDMYGARCPCGLVIWMELR